MRNSIHLTRFEDIFSRLADCLMSLDSLQAVLIPKAKDSVEGIYYYDRFLTIGLYRPTGGS